MTATILSLGAFPHVLEGFDMDAQITKTHSHDANKATLRVYNLPDELRSAVQGRKVQFSISAGYKIANNKAQIGLFDIKKAHSTLEGPTWVTHLEGGEARDALQDALVSLSVGAGQTAAQVAQQVVNTLVAEGIGAGNFAETLGAVQIPYFAGFCMEGRSKDVLKAICQRFDFTYSVQSGALQFLKKGEGDQTRTFKISPDTGLIGVPVPGEADASKGKKPQIHVKALCQPNIIPGSFIDVFLPVQFAARGKMKVQKVVHDLSTYAQPFYTKMECEMGAAVDTFTQAVLNANIA